MWPLIETRQMEKARQCVTRRMMAWIPAIAESTPPNAEWTNYLKQLHMFLGPSFFVNNVRLPTCACCTSERFRLPGQPTKRCLFGCALPA